MVGDGCSTVSLTVVFHNILLQSVSGTPFAHVSKSRYVCAFLFYTLGNYKKTQVNTRHLGYGEVV